MSANGKLFFAFAFSSGDFARCSLEEVRSFSIPFRSVKLLLLRSVCLEVKLIFVEHEEPFYCREYAQIPWSYRKSTEKVSVERLASRNNQLSNKLVVLYHKKALEKLVKLLERIMYRYKF